MAKISKSPQRGSFQRDGYIKRVATGEASAEAAEAMLDFYSNWDLVQAEREASEEWKEHNMEYDLRTTDWILEKVRASEVYAQHLYAAMCNNDFQKNEFIPRLAGQVWGCSWRHAGGIVADMREQGDYIDWYCSGIRGDSLTEDEFNSLTEEQKISYKESQAFVSESVVTDEIREDLRRLGWTVEPYTEG